MDRPIPNPQSLAAGEALDAVSAVEMYVEPLLAIIHRDHVARTDPAQHARAAAPQRLGAELLCRRAADEVAEAGGIAAIARIARLDRFLLGRHSGAGHG